MILLQSSAPLFAPVPHPELRPMLVLVWQLSLILPWDISTKCPFYCASIQQILKLILITATLSIRDVTDCASASDGIRHFFGNPKSDGYLKSDRVGFKIANCWLNSVTCWLPKIIQCISTIVNVTAEVKLNNSTLTDRGLLCFLYFFENNHNYFSRSLLVHLQLLNFK